MEIASSDLRRRTDSSFGECSPPSAGGGLTRNDTMKFFRFFLAVTFFLNLEGARHAVPLPLSYLAPRSAVDENNPFPIFLSYNPKPPIVIALGGNAFGVANTQLHGRYYWESFRPQVKQTAQEIAELIVQGEKVVITFGNGPQVGHEFAGDPKKPLYEHVLTTQQEMGFLLEEEIRLALKARLDQLPWLPRVANIITHVRVDSQDPAWQKPTKLIGIFLRDQVESLAIKDRGWEKKATTKGWRLVVPSPFPRKILEIDRIRRFVERGDIVIACGGGGIPVDEHGAHKNGVIDKDLASSLLAVELGARGLVILTEENGIYLDYENRGTTAPVQQLSLKEIKTLLSQDSTRKQFPDGSIRPKMEGSALFVEKSPRVDAFAVIARLGNLGKAIREETGTRIQKERTVIDFPAELFATAI